MSTLVLTIDDVDMTPDHQTLRITKVAKSRGSLRCEVTSPDGSYSTARGTPVVFTEDGTPIFGGVIRNVKRRGVDNKITEAVTNEIECDDFAVLADRRYVTLTLLAGPLKEQIEQLVPYLAIYGVTLDGAQVDGPDLIEMPLVNRRVSDAFLDICKAASEITGTEWVFRIDPLKVLSFSDVDDLAAPFDINTATDNPRVDFEDVPVEKSGERYANRVILLAGGTQPRDINAHVYRGSQPDAENNALDQAIGKYYGPGTPIGGYRCWNLSPLIDFILYGTAGRGSLKIVRAVDPPEPFEPFPQSLTPIAYINPDTSELADNGPGRRHIHERTFDILKDEPFGFWPLNEPPSEPGTTAGDAGSGGNDGTIQGGAEADRTRLGVTFDGVNDRIDLSGLTNFGDTWAAELMFTPDATQSDTRGLLFGVQATGDGIVWNKTSGKIEVRDGGVTIAESSALTSGQQYRVFVSCDAGAVTIYIDGLEDGTGTGFLVANDPDGIGGDGSNAFSFKGLIRNVAYYPGETFAAEDVVRHYGRTIDRLMQANTDPILTADDYIAVGYTGHYPIIVVAEDRDAQGPNYENLVEVIEEAPFIFKQETAETYAAAKLAERLNVAGSVRYLTDQVGLEPGQRQHITAAERQIDDDYIINQVEIADVGGDFLARTVTAVAGNRLPPTPRETLPIYPSPTPPTGPPEEPELPTTGPVGPGVPVDIPVVSPPSAVAPGEDTGVLVNRGGVTTTFPGLRWLYNNSRLRMAGLSDSHVAQWSPTPSNNGQELMLGAELVADDYIARSVAPGEVYQDDNSIGLYQSYDETPGGAWTGTKFAALDMSRGALVFDCDAANPLPPSFITGWLSMFGSLGTDRAHACAQKINSTLTDQRSIVWNLGDADRQIHFDVSGFVKWT